MNRSRLRAFTLLELIVVIGLIALLGSLLLIGVGHLITNSKRQATQLAFQNCQAMYAEWDRVARMHFPSYKDPSYSMVAMPCPQNVTLDYFNNAVNGIALPASAPAVDRYGYGNGHGVLFTRDLISLMRSMPVNAAALGKMSAKATMVLQYPNPNPSSGPTPLPPAEPISPATWVANSPYNVMDRVQLGTDASGNLSPGYVCIQAVPYIEPSGIAYYAPTSDRSFWLPALIDPTVSQMASESQAQSWTQSTVPVLLDGWGNPIIFVASGLLGVAKNNANLNPNGTVVTGTGAIESGSGSSAVPIQVQSPDGRPFWASAGPDGDFSLGDDNMYSFEK